MTDEELLKVIEKAAASKATGLDLSHNQLTALPQELFQLKNLTELNLSVNRLTALPLELFQLTNLTQFDLSSNQLIALPPEICQLKNLTHLNLSVNRLTTLPPELFQLTNLTRLDLSGNWLTALPPKIFQLTKLKTLWFSDNRLIALPLELFNLSNLTGLLIDDNRLTVLPPEICQLTKLKVLRLFSNPLISPPFEIAMQGIEAVRQYFAALEEEDQPLNEVKLLLIGDGAAGKTSLVKQLLGQTFNPHEDTTHGINIRGWEVKAGDKAIKVNIWDFGGQEIMHATHQFFLSKRSLYVLVLDGRRDERPEYWLRHIESFGGDSPVLIVLNKHDSHPGFDLNRPFLLQKYPSVKGFIRTSCATGHGISKFRKTLLRELARVEMLETRWPGSWFRVKERLEEMREPYISCDAYSDICAEAGLAEEGGQEVLVEFLHDLGTAVHFKDFTLKATHVLDPKWVTAGVYKIINAPEVAAAGGILHLDNLEAILRQEKGEEYSFSQETHGYIIELMKKFELCYELDKERVLIPQLLPVAEPPFTFDDAASLRFVLRYNDFLPLSVLSRFIVKRHQEIRDDLRWRTGVVLEDRESGSIAVIRADNEARRISLRVNGPRRKEYLAFLWFSLREINDSFERLNVSARVPMPDDPERAADYDTLLRYAELGVDVHVAEGSGREYSVLELLGLIQPEGEDEVLGLMRKIDRRLDDEDIVNLKPNFYGIGLNLNKLFKRLSGREKRK